MMSLPRLTGGAFRDAISEIPYLSPMPSVVEHWAPKFKDKSTYRVAICWQGNPGYKEDGLRSIPLFYFEKLCEDPSVELWSLQKGTGLEQVGAFGARDSLVLSVQNSMKTAAHSWIRPQLLALLTWW